jgi:hypothetical protein
LLGERISTIKIGSAMTGSGLVFRADHRQIRDPAIMFRLNPGNNARIREHTARVRQLREMVRDKPAKLRLYGTMGPAGGRHRLRLSVHELPKTAIPRVPGEKFRDGHQPAAAGSLSGRHKDSTAANIFKREDSKLSLKRKRLKASTDQAFSALLAC